jgi:pseudouridine-5'-phosphate glycosidase
LGIKGKQVTPYLLKRVSELTSGASLKINLELLRSNASLAAQIAKELD